MWNQTNLLGQELKIPSKITEVCCESCYTAKEEKCTCQCHGAYHGLGNLNKAKIDSSYEKQLPEPEAQIIRKQYGSVESRKPLCLCGYDLSKEPIIYYTPHDYGWTVEGEPRKCWLYVKCPNCGYDMAVWKMGVPRE